MSREHKVTGIRKVAGGNEMGSHGAMPRPIVGAVQAPGGAVPERPAGSLLKTASRRSAFVREDDAVELQLRREQQSERSSSRGRRKTRAQGEDPAE